MVDVNLVTLLLIIRVHVGSSAVSVVSTTILPFVRIGSSAAKLELECTTTSTQIIFAYPRNGVCVETCIADDLMDPVNVDPTRTDARLRLQLVERMFEGSIATSTAAGAARK